MSTSSNPLLRQWNSLSMLLKIIIVNIAVFLTLRTAGIVASIAGWDMDTIMSFFILPNTVTGALHHPWTVITYMWTHYHDIWHIIFNMLWLYWFGSLFLFISTPKQLLALYIYGGVGGAIAYLTATAMIPAVGGNGLIGASAAVIAIVIATAIINPDQPVRLLFLGTIKLKWVAIATIIIFSISITGTNSGGEVAHMGGAAVGALYGIFYRRGIDITRPFNRAVDAAVTAAGSLLSPRRRRYKHSSSRRDTGAKKQQSAGPRYEAQEELDKILDKIKKSGYSSLTAEEKKRLFDVSRRV